MAYNKRIFNTMKDCFTNLSSKFSFQNRASKFYMSCVAVNVAIVAYLSPVCEDIAIANEVTSIRAYAGDDNTRIVFEMSDVPSFKSRIIENGSAYELRILQIDDPAKKFGLAKINQSSVISRITRGIRKNEIVYVFYLKNKVIPNAFSLRKQGNQKDRLVIDFPHEAKVVQTHSTSQKPKAEEPASIKEVSSTKELEAELLATLNSEGDNAEDDFDETLDQRLAKPEPPKPQQSMAKKGDNVCMVVVDPGHGGKDPGAISKSGLQEKKVTLSISKYLLEYLKGDSSVNGYLTRSNDKFIELGNRSEIARKQKADILISIHADSASNSAASGASVLVLAPNRAKRENGKLEQDKEKQKQLLGGAGEMISTISRNNPNIDVADWIIEMSSDTSISFGRELARDILSSIKNVARLHNKNPIDRSLAVLKAPDIPSLLIEVGYLSNTDESKLLATQKYNREVAYYIYKGIQKFVKNNPTLCVHNVSQNNNSSEITYTVKKGDTLAKIAQAHKVSVENLKKRNNLKKNALQIGQKLVIPK